VASTAESIDQRPRGYRGPRRLGIAGLLTFVPGVALALGLATTVLASSASSFVGDLARPAINLVLEAVGQHKIPERGDDVSMLLVLTFVGSIVVASLGACALVLSSLWSIARFQPGKRLVVAYRHVRPETRQLPMEPAAPAALPAAPDEAIAAPASDAREAVGAVRA
jgi:hypothetical protein